MQCSYFETSIWDRNPDSGAYSYSNEFSDDMSNYYESIAISIFEKTNVYADDSISAVAERLELDRFKNNNVSPSIAEILCQPVDELTKC